MTALFREMTAETVNLQFIDCSYFYAAEILDREINVLPSVTNPSVIHY